MSMLTHIFQQKPAPNSEKVLRRILHEDEVWYWDPATNVVDKRAIKQNKKDKKEKREKKIREKREKKEQKDKNVTRSEPNTARKALTTSDDICWRKAEVNKGSAKREDSTITLGNPAEAIEKSLGIKFTDRNNTKLQTYPLHHSASFAGLFRRSRGSSSSSSASNSSASEQSSEDESDDPKNTAPQTVNKLRLISLRQSTKPSTSSSSSSTTSNVDSTPGSTCSSTTSSTNTSPITSPRSTTTTTTTTNGSPAASPRSTLTTARMKLKLALRKSIKGPSNANVLFAEGQSTSPTSPTSPRSPRSPTRSPRLDINERVPSVEASESQEIEQPRCPTPLAIDREDSSSDNELELQSIDELTDDSSSEATGFWVRERTHRPPQSRIPPTPYFDLILKSFDDCL